ncbi:hypothetical protein [Sphingomonas natans]|uniref:hypothetical protein n=1 Tax=Sphingomonas natans TaxID=3063330 RepID=UPI003D66E82D
MAAKGDAQNPNDPGYLPLLQNGQPAGIAFEAACALIFEGLAQPNGYTEPLLHTFRSAAKQSLCGDSSALPSGAVAREEFAV